MNKTIKILHFLTTMSFMTSIEIQSSSSKKEESLVLKIQNNSNNPAVLSEVEYSCAFIVNEEIKKQVIHNTTNKEFSGKQAKNLGINVSIPIPSPTSKTTSSKKSSVSFQPMGITAITIHSVNNSKDAKTIIIKPPYYHLNVANAKPAPSICINYNTNDGWHIEKTCKKITSEKNSKTTTPSKVSPTSKQKKLTKSSSATKANPSVNKKNSNAS